MEPNTPAPTTPPPSQPELSSEQHHLQQTSTVLNAASSVLKITGAALSRIGREIAMMILKR